MEVICSLDHCLLGQKESLRGSKPDRQTRLRTYLGTYYLIVNIASFYLSPLSVSINLLLSFLFLFFFSSSSFPLLLSLFAAATSHWLLLRPHSHPPATTTRHHSLIDPTYLLQSRRSVLQVSPLFTSPSPPTPSLQLIRVLE